MNDMVGIVSGVVGLAGYAPYIVDILRRRTQPERTSWFIWMLEYAVLCTAQIVKNAGPAVWLAGLQLAGVVVVCGLSLKFGVGQADRKSKVILVCTCAALVAWLFSSDPDVAICLLIAVEASGVVLTALKVYHQPGSETLTMWLLLSAAGAIGIFAVPPGSDSILYLYPLFLICVGLVVTCASWLGARKNAPAPMVEDLSPAD